jgi:alkyl hydroperoxide reductase subunit AhpC
VARTAALPPVLPGKLAVVWRNDALETLAWAKRSRAEGGPGTLTFPLIVDPNGQMAALYGVASGKEGSLWGQFIIDSSGVIRQAVVSGFPVWAGVDELLRHSKNVEAVLVKSCRNNI